MNAQQPTGLLVSVDGPGGVGKSTAVLLATEQLIQRELVVHATTEPSRTPLGDLIRSGTDTYSGLALACLVAGDRYHHLEMEVRPHRAAGAVVLCDRYVPSSLVLQRIDTLDWDTIWSLNAAADRPDLAVILGAAPTIIAARLASRGGHSRFERLPDASRIESDLYRDTAERLTAAGWPVHQIDCTARTPHEVAAIITDQITDLKPTGSSHNEHRAVVADLQYR